MPEITIKINVSPLDYPTLTQDLESLADRIRETILDRLYVEGLNTHDVDAEVKYN